MNREQRRATVKKGVTHKDLKELVEHNISTGFDEGHKAGFEEGLTMGMRQGVDAGVKGAVENYTIVLAYVLSKKQHYSNNRVVEALRKIQEVFDQVDKGTIAIDDLKSEVQDLLAYEEEESPME